MENTNKTHCNASNDKHRTEAGVRRSSLKQVLLKISQYSPENIRVGVSENTCFQKQCNPIGDFSRRLILTSANFNKYTNLMTLRTVPEKMRLSASAGGSVCKVMNLLAFIFFPARFLCFLVSKVLDLQYLRKSKKIGSLTIELEASKISF